MKMRYTFVLCVVAAVGVLAAVLVERGGRDGGRRGNGAGHEVVELPVDEVERIVLERRDEAALIFRRDGDRWDQAAPFPHPMDPHSIRQLALLASGLRVVDVIDSDDPSERDAMLGLDPARARITYEWPGGSLSLRLGRRGFAGRAYLRVDGREGILVVNHDLHERAVEMEPKEWRDRQIFHGVGVDSDRIDIVSAMGDTVLYRDRKQWRMLTPVPNRLDERARDDLFQALGRAQSGGFIDDAPEDVARFGLSNPAGSITVTTSRMVRRDGATVRETEEQRLLVGSRMGVGSEDRYGMIEGRPVVVRLPEPVLTALFRPPQDLVAATASGVVASDVKTIVIRTAAEEIRLDRDLERWIAPDHRGLEVPYERVEGLLETLTRLRAMAVEIRAYPRELEVATITMLGYGARVLDTVRVAQEPDGAGRWILENGDDVLRFYPSGLEIGLASEWFGLSPSSSPEASGTR